MSERLFYEQVNYTKGYLIAYLQKKLKNFDKTKKILEVGCAEGGTVYELRNQGYLCDGIEIEKGRAEIAKKHIKESAKIVVGDITKPLEIQDKYDVVIMRDVIEHIADKEKALSNIANLLNEGGILFLTFPLKFSPYAGHNQNAKNWIKYVWYITLFPKFIIRLMVPSQHYESYVYLKENALSFRKLKRLIKPNWKFVWIDFFISRPIYKVRFGWRIIKAPKIPIIRELTNGCEVVIEKCT